MNLNVINDDGIIKQYPIEKEHFHNKSFEGRVGYIGTQSKEANALNIYKAYFSNAKAILLDESNMAIVKQLHALEIPIFPKYSMKQSIFDTENYTLMYFTSGSTGHPVAALKTKENIEEEVKALAQLFEKYHIKKVIVTVPFIHLYGTLFGLMYPLFNQLDIVIKEHFLPHDLLDIVEDHTMVVTTPLYIKALNQSSETMQFKNSVFVSSTAALATEDVEQFNRKFQSDIIQIFGSTETGGIAYKVNSERLWKPFEGVKISVNEQNELKVRSPFVSNAIYEDGMKETRGEIQTFDYIEKESFGFTLLGRSSKIFKLAGKRYSTVQIENILEEREDIAKALVFTGLDKNSLRGEYLDITIESKKKYKASEIKKILQIKLSNLKFAIKLEIVDHIPVNQVGKKLKLT